MIKNINGIKSQVESIKTNLSKIENEISQLSDDANAELPKMRGPIRPQMLEFLAIIDTKETWKKEEIKTALIEVLSSVGRNIRLEK